MVTNTVLYVVGVAGPALLLAIAVDSLRARPFRVLDALAWTVMAGALVLALVYPAFLEAASLRIGISVPIALVSFVGIGALFAGYVRQTARVAALKARVLELEAGPQPDGAVESDRVVAAEAEADPGRAGASPRRGGSASA